MSAWTDLIGPALFIGIGATAFMDAANLLIEKLFGMRAPDYTMVGRWIGHFPRGRFAHDSIAKAAPVAGEAALGWAAHYAVGVSYAVALLAVAGAAWADAPTFAPAIAVGLVSVAAPFLIMQPGMGAGFFASRTPRPNTARARSVFNHALFGVGLYLAAALRAAVL